MKQMIFFFTLVFSLSLFASDKAKTVSLNISGMSCEHCASKVEKALKHVNGVKEAKVNLKNNKATVTVASAAASTELLIKAVSDAGFDASEGTSAPKTEMKKHSKSDGTCDDGCCDENGKTGAKKMKKAETKKS